MNLLIVSSSQRVPSESARVGQYLKTVTKNLPLKEETSVSHLDLTQLNIPIWDGDERHPDVANSDWPIICKQLDKADAYILITPEWGGMATPVLKNFLLMCHWRYTAHKPVLLVSVVNGISGAYPIAELRMNAFKNNKMVPLPDHLIIRYVNERLHNPEADTKVLTQRDANLRSRIAHYLFMLQQYSEALRPIHIAFNQLSNETKERYKFGM